MTNKTQTHNKNSIMEALLASKTIKNIRKGEEIDATILKLSKKAVLFDLGAKAHAVLGDRELRQVATYLPYLEKGQNIAVRVVSEESRDGYPVVSLQRFFDKGKWKILESKKEKEETIEVVCGEYGKGGVFIDFMGIRGVIPKIQLTQEFLQDPSKLQGQRIEVKVLEVDEAKNRLVVSKKAAELNISQKELKERFDKIKEGETYEANVLGASEFGIFCEIDGVEGLVHISEISWEKVTNASIYVKPGDTIKVLVVEKNAGDLKLNLSIKRLQSDPWKDIQKRYPKDKEHKGEVIRKERYGYFVRLEPGVEGLIHISKLTGEENINIGDTVGVFIERINTKERRISLVLPQREKPIFYR
ncbi:S1 RNA-binding domain-containing protein [Candidatus Woesebacteria bacterium]|nr:S1 RNA-binding domain-containing protein [Candidatus Woesebacteria bacterium]